eukprot:TRINITY_DN20336_c0_g1_i1.p1 TRINITY_DN20336_c0_g1~~TRINITY_DN20336_c0_g1_i1.p1  ORF type:complete len:1405 (-),score=181.91 TRINITY_DN20336_c0_g1_i1:117-3782(-)
MAPALASVCISFAVVLVLPASLVLTQTISKRTRLLAEAYSSAGAYAAEVLGGIRTVASLGLERFAIARYDETLVEAEKVAIRTTAKLAFSLSTMSAFVFYVCATASLYSLSVFEPHLRQSAFSLEAPVVLPSRPGNVTTVGFCVPSACERPFDPFLLLQALASSDAGEVIRYSDGYTSVECSPGYEKFQASCVSGEGLQQMSKFFPSEFLPADFIRIAFDRAGATWPCNGNVNFELILIVLNSMIFGFVMLPQIPTSFQALMNGMIAAHSCLKLMLRVPPIDSFSPDGKILDHVRGAILVKDITFAYPASPSFKVCSGYSLDIPAGSSCALVGPSGAGKSTIINLLQRFYDPQGGVITLDGHDIKSLNLAWLRTQLGLVGQEPILFHGSVAENVRYGKDDATQEDMNEAARQANALDFIMNDLSDGFDTDVGQGGSKLSGGQKQRVAIARALIKKPTVLLLDEATSSLDYSSEKVVQAAIDTIMSDFKSTCIIIAHRLSTVRHCSKIAVVDRGKVVEEGTYDELLALGEKGLFHKLAASQEKQDREDRLARQSRAEADAEAELNSEYVKPSEHAAMEQTEKESSDHKIAVVEGKETKKSPASRAGELYTKADKRWRLPLGFFSCLLCSIASGFVGLIIVNASFSFRDEADPNRLSKIVTTWGIATFCIGIFVHVVEFVYRTQFAIAGEGLTRRLRVHTLEKLLHQELGYFDEDENSVGALTEFLARKVNLVQGVAQDGLQQLISLLGVFITATVVSVVFGDWRLMLVFVAGYAVGIILLVAGQLVTNSQEDRHKQQGAKTEEQSAEAKAAGALVGEVVVAIKTVFSFNAEHKFLDLYSQLVAKERRSQGNPRRIVLGSLAMGVGMATMMVVFGFSMFYGMWLMEVDIQSFMFAVSNACPLPTVGVGRLMVPFMSFVMSMMALGNNAAVLVDANAGKEAAKALFERIDRKSLRDPFSEEGGSIPELRGDIKVENVVFAYPTRPNVRVCRGYNLCISAGSVCALVGPSGAGKSTLVSLLLRFYDPQGGVISLDGRDITTFNLAWLRAQLGFVGQEPVLFQGSVAENIGFGKAGASQHEVEEAAKQANAHGFITDALARGYETQVGLRGSQLSGGQKQRVAIARALVRQPTVLLLDEATSALDSESERIVQAALDEIMTKQKRTTIVIAHRLSTIRNAGQIAVVNKGRIEECGTHEELRDSGGTYAALLAAQSHDDQRTSIVQA